MERERDRERDRETEKETEKERERDRKREKETESRAAARGCLDPGTAVSVVRCVKLLMSIVNLSNIMTWPPLPSCNANCMPYALGPPKTSYPLKVLRKTIVLISES